MADQTYQVGAGIAHETLGGEAILINFTTGSYYSLDGTGGLIWTELSRGAATSRQIAATLASGTTTDPEALLQTIAAFLEALEHEGLATRNGAGTPGVPARAEAHDGPREESGGRTPFAAPVLKKYTDLEALLLLDPIHDVLATGWPNTKPDAS